MQKANLLIVLFCVFGIFGTMGGYALDQIELGGMILQLILFVALIITQIVIYSLVERIERLEKKNIWLLKQYQNKKECSQSPARRKHSDDNSLTLYHI